MRILFYVLIHFVMSFGGVSVAQVQAGASYPRVDADLKNLDDTVREMKNQFAQQPSDPQNTEWIKKKLKHMVDADQYVRKQSDLPFLQKYTDEEERYFNELYLVRLKQIDNENTDELEKLLKIYNWFVISRFGAETDKNAWLLVQHADEHAEFQKRVLVVLADLYKVKETNSQNYAYLFDRVAASYSDPSKRKLQRYGTQGACVEPGVWEPIPMEDPANVDARRAEVGLGTMAEYIAVFKEICH